MILDMAIDGRYKKMLSKECHQYVSKVRSSIKRFVFDAGASHRVGSFAVNHTDLVCRYAVEPRMPFPNTYIELETKAVITGLGGNPEPIAADRIGFVITPIDIYTLSGAGTAVAFEPYVLCKGDAVGKKAGEWVNRTGNWTDEMITHNYKSKYRLMIGQSNLTADDLIDCAKPYLDAYEIGLNNEKIPDEIMELSIKEGSGSFKWAFTAMMLLEERVRAKHTTVPAERRFFGSKLRAVPAHSLISIDLDDDRIRKVFDGHGGIGLTHALHDVSEHWFTKNLSSQCRHEWQEMHSVYLERRDVERHGHILPRQICALCGGMRTRRQSHERGDRSKPKTTKGYKVTASKEKL